MSPKVENSGFLSFFKIFHHIFHIRITTKFPECGTLNVFLDLHLHCPIADGGGVPESVEAVPMTYLSIVCVPGIFQVFQGIANADGGVMFNCSAGKDRTGVVSAILLSHAGVRDKDIIENYVLIKEYGKDRLALVHQNFLDIDMNIVTPREDFVLKILRIYRERFHSTELYFKEIGLNELEIAKITEKCVN